MLPLLAAGCDNPQVRTNTSAAQPVQSQGNDRSLAAVKMPDHNPEEGPRAVFSRPMQRLIVQFRVHLITAPAGTFGPDSLLWKIAAASMPTGVDAARQTSNGFRAAVGRESDREGLMQFLDSVEGVKMKMDEITPDLDKPMQIELGACAPLLSIFHFDRAGRLHGSDYADSVARFVLQFDMRSTNLKEVWLRVTPELEEPPGPPKWRRGPDGEFREMPEEHRYFFSDVEMSARIPEGGFLAIGPSPLFADTPTLGRVFFREPETSPKEGLEAARERIYIISPIIRYAEAPAPQRDGP